jgi:hypothetical protein
MKHRALAVLLSFFALPALAQLPQRDLRVELRQVEESSGAMVVSTQTRPPFESQQIQVRNGSPASVSVGQTLPMQWVQAVLALPAEQGASAPVASTPNPNQRSGGVVNQMTWLHVGQRLTVLPRWPGGKKDVSVEVEVQSSQVDARTGPELPAQSQNQVRTTLSAPLGQWVTLAVTGKSTPGGISYGTYGSEATAEPRRLLQLRVTAP